MVDDVMYLVVAVVLVVVFAPFVFGVLGAFFSIGLWLVPAFFVVWFLFLRN